MKGQNPVLLGDFFPYLEGIPVRNSGVDITMTQLAGKFSKGLDSDSDMVTAMWGILSCLKALGVINIDNNPSSGLESTTDLEISYVSEGAKDFAVSLALCSKQSIPATETWLFERDPRLVAWKLLYEMEENRYRYAADKGLLELEPVRKETVVVVIIKSRIKKFGKYIDVYLCQFDYDSGHYNFIGGKRRHKEDLTIVAKSKLHKELSLDPKSCEVSPIDIIQKPIRSAAISKETGVYTEYDFYPYFVNRIGSPVRESNRKNRWFTFDELTSGKGQKGEEIMAHKRILDALSGELNPNIYPNGLNSLKLSVENANLLQATPLPERLWNEVFSSWNNLVIFFAALFTILTITVGFIIYLLKTLGLIQ